MSSPTPKIPSSNQLISNFLFTVSCIEERKIKKKRPRMDQFIKKNLHDAILRPLPFKLANVAVVMPVAVLVTRVCPAPKMGQHCFRG